MGWIAPTMTCHSTWVSPCTLLRFCKINIIPVVWVWQAYPNTNPAIPKMYLLIIIFWDTLSRQFSLPLEDRSGEIEHSVTVVLWDLGKHQNSLSFTTSTNTARTHGERSRKIWFYDSYTLLQTQCDASLCDFVEVLGIQVIPGSYLDFTVPKLQTYSN